LLHDLNYLSLIHNFFNNISSEDEQQRLISEEGGGVPNPDLFPIAGVPGLHGVPEFDLILDNLSDPMHMIMNNIKDVFKLMQEGLTKSLKKSERVCMVYRGALNIYMKEQLSSIISFLYLI
jgi:hypothetical protein